MKKIFYLAFVLLSFSCTTAEIPLMEVPIDRTVTYQRDIQPIIFNNCLTCHSSINPANGLTLESYSQVKNSTQNGSLITRINDAANPMPQNGLLTASNRALFDKWKVDGYIE